MTTIERFERYCYPEPNSGCWLWTGSEGKGGYGKFQMGAKPVAAHRMAYTLFVAPIPPGAHVLHKCDTPLCVNPDHLFLGTHQTNMDDMSRKRRVGGNAIARRGLPFGVFRNGLRFMACISLKGTWTYLGMYATPEEAHAVAVAAREASRSYKP